MTSSMAQAKTGNNKAEHQEAWTTWLQQPGQLSEEKLAALRQRFPLDSRSYLVALLRAVLQGNVENLPPCFLFRIGPAWRHYLFLWKEWRALQTTITATIPAEQHHRDQDKITTTKSLQPSQTESTPDTNATAEAETEEVSDQKGFSKDEPRTFVEWLVALQQRHAQKGKSSPLLASHAELARVKELLRQLSPKRGEEKEEPRRSG